MTPTPIADFKKPLPIDAEELSYLKDRLGEATIYSHWGERPKKHHSGLPTIGNIVVNNITNKHDALSYIEFSPSGWSHLYGQDPGDILKDLSGIILNYNLSRGIYYGIHITYSDNLGTKESFDPSLTFNKSGKPQLAIDTKGVKIYGEEGIDVLQNLWSRMIDRFDKESSSS